MDRSEIYVRHIALVLAVESLVVDLLACPKLRHGCGPICRPQNTAQYRARKKAARPIALVGLSERVARVRRRLAVLTEKVFDVCKLEWISIAVVGIHLEPAQLMPRFLVLVDWE